MLCEKKFVVLNEACWRTTASICPATQDCMTRHGLKRMHMVLSTTRSSAPSPAQSCSMTVAALAVCRPTRGRRLSAGGRRWRRPRRPSTPPRLKTTTPNGNPVAFEVFDVVFLLMRLSRQRIFGRASQGPRPQNHTHNRRQKSESYPVGSKTRARLAWVCGVSVLIILGWVGLGSMLFLPYQGGWVRTTEWGGRKPYLSGTQHVGDGVEGMSHAGLVLEQNTWLEVWLTGRTHRSAGTRWAGRRSPPRCSSRAAPDPRTWRWGT